MAITDPVFTVSENGISAPTYDEILNYFKEQARQIFGADIVLDNDSQDGQLLAIVAAALSDVNAQAIATYNAFNPQTAKGVALDNAVAVNGLTRREATNSEVDVRLVGQAGTIINNGVVFDAFENRWLLPDTVTIPSTGEITVTATAEEAGAISAAVGSVNRIGTPTLGWQSVSNPSAAAVGVAVETDNELQARQARSTALPSVSLWTGIIAALLNTDGVTRVTGINNDTDSTDANGVPAHSIAMIVDGGDVAEIGETIFKRKGEGCGTYGSTMTTYVDEYGFPNDIYFSRPVIKQISVTLTITASASYLSTDGDAAKVRIAEYINALSIGESVNLVRVLGAAIALAKLDMDERFDVTSITMGADGGAETAADIAIDWNEAASCDVSDVTVVVN